MILGEPEKDRWPHVDFLASYFATRGLVSLRNLNVKGVLTIQNTFAPFWSYIENLDEDNPLLSEFRANGVF